jgi:hypothetical protein
MAVYFTENRISWVYVQSLSLTTDQNATPAYFKDLLSVHEELVHITVELNAA